ncbi:RNA polymerase sigma factor [Planctomicrobium sp. SH664]|uniref:RNA polymerase sigma factor n=1 Tax=Planctomicrobium sp. SH664 TaxID=3448125 RepID=UPI003F5BD595
MTDDQLMILVQSGEAGAFDVLVDRYRGMLIGFFLKNTRDLQFSEDLAQETLLKVYHQAWDYLPVNRFRGWMFRIARNLLIDNVRRRSNDALLRAYQQQSDEEEAALNRLIDEITTPDQQLVTSEFNELLNRILMEIPEDQRQAFLLHYYSGIPLTEVAEIMEVPEPTCKSRLRLARQKIAEKLRLKGFSPRQENE